MLTRARARPLKPMLALTAGARSALLAARSSERDRFQYDVLTRLLVPGVHYLAVPLPELNPRKGEAAMAAGRRALCTSVQSAIDWAEANPAPAEAMASAGKALVRDTLTMEAVYEYMAAVLTRASEVIRYDPIEAIETHRVLKSAKREPFNATNVTRVPTVRLPSPCPRSHPPPAREPRKPPIWQPHTACYDALAAPPRSGRTLDARPTCAQDPSEFIKTLRNDTTYPITAQITPEEWAAVVMRYNYSRMGHEFTQSAIEHREIVRKLIAEQKQKDEAKRASQRRPGRSVPPESSAAAPEDGSRRRDRGDQDLGGGGRPAARRPGRRRHARHGGRGKWIHT